MKLRIFGVLDNDKEHIKIFLSFDKIFDFFHIQNTMKSNIIIYFNYCVSLFYNQITLENNKLIELVSYNFDLSLIFNN